MSGLGKAFQLYNSGNNSTISLFYSGRDGIICDCANNAFVFSSEHLALWKRLIIYWTKSSCNQGKHPRV